MQLHSSKFSCDLLKLYQAQCAKSLGGFQSLRRAGREAVEGCMALKLVVVSL